MDGLDAVRRAEVVGVMAPDYPPNETDAAYKEGFAKGRQETPWCFAFGMLAGFIIETMMIVMIFIAGIPW